MRVGFGYDVHAFCEDRKLILAGEEIPFSRGLLGHSDADVLTHAVMDALLGAAALGDIGRHFPDTDQKYKGACSLDLLRETLALIEARGYAVNNIDATVVAQKPKLASYIGKMVENYCFVTGLTGDDINIKATTTEKLGFAGREEGIAAYAVCTLTKKIQKL